MFIGFIGDDRCTLAGNVTSFIANTVWPLFHYCAHFRRYTAQILKIVFMSFNKISDSAFVLLHLPKLAHVVVRLALTPF